MRRTGWVALLLVVVSACSSGGTPSARPSPSPSRLDFCVSSTEASLVHLVASDGQAIAGAVFGAGTKGVFLGHMGSGDLCAWVDFARGLASNGYLVLAIDYRAFGSSQLQAGREQFAVVRDTVAAIDELRRRGAHSIVLVGASLGAMASMQAAASVTPPVQGVVQISGPIRFTGLDISASLPHVRVPVLFICGENDVTSEENIPRDLRTQYARIPAKDKRLVLLPNEFAHGTKIFESLSAERFRSEIESFIAAHSRAA